MGAIETRTFKSGNSVAVRLPKSLGFAAGVPVVIEQVGDTITLRASVDMTEEKRKLTELITRLRDVWGDEPRPVFDREATRIEFPDRPGLY